MKPITQTDLEGALARVHRGDDLTRRRQQRESLSEFFRRRNELMAQLGRTSSPKRAPVQGGGQ